MRSKIFKPVAVALMALMAMGNTVFAQDAKTADSSVQTETSSDVIVTPSVKITSPIHVEISPVTVDLRQLKSDLKDLKVTSKAQLKAVMKDLNVDITADVKDIAPQIDLSFKDGYDGAASADDNDDNNLTKSYSKTYSVDNNDIVSISNQYGKVIVNTWARNEVKVDVQIKVGASDPDVAKKLLNFVNINDSKDGNSISFTTTIGDVKKSWIDVFSGDGGHSVEINYTVYMPAKNDLTVKNQYGPIVIPDMDSKITINSGYGSFKGGILSKQSDIRVKYGNADIESVGNCAIDVGYGKLTIGSADKIAANISYSGVKIGRLRESGAINIKYGGGIDIDNVEKSVRSLAINASYTNVNLGLANDANSNFAIVTHYGDFNYDGHDVTITSKTPDDSDGHPHFTKSYKGYIGKAGSDRTIAINTSYGNIRFQ